MIRPAFTEIGIFLIPFAVYALFLIATRSGLLMQSSWPAQRVAKLVLGSLLLVVTISAFWYVPFYAYRLYTNDLNFQPVTGLRLLFPLAVPIEIVLTIFFVAGLVDAFANDLNNAPNGVGLS